jgi:bifunctional DNA-binding transcriptional regulator/antitoxin component of YhaV-PrlF toxin-antitoxin module
MQNLQTQPEIPTNQWQTHIAAHGRLNIPVSLRKAAGIKDGDEVILTLNKDQTIQIQSIYHAIEEAQALVAKHFGEDDLQAELKAMRTDDAAREAKKLGKKDSL